MLLFYILLISHPHSANIFVKSLRTLASSGWIWSELWTKGTLFQLLFLHLKYNLPLSSFCLFSILNEISLRIESIKHSLWMIWLHWFLRLGSTWWFRCFSAHICLRMECAIFHFLFSIIFLLKDENSGSLHYL